MTVPLLNTKPRDEWLDRVIVHRVLNGHHDQVTRPLSKAEKLAIIGAVLDQIYADAVAGLFSEHSQLNVIMKRYGLSRHTTSELGKIARPEHAERMRRARRAYIPWDDLADGRHRTVEEIAA